MDEEKTPPDSQEKPLNDFPKGDESYGDPAHTRETTRSKIAIIYLYAFFGTIGVAFFIGFCECYKVNDYKDILLAVSGVLSGPLGFIIGYYFKAAKE